MLIKDIFQKDICRPINGVVKADQDDDNTVFQELDEYVVTKELFKHFSDFFEAYNDSTDIMNNVGVWVSGFFGSGKSHFIKILSYLLENRVVKNGLGEEKKALDFFDESKIKDAMLRADIAKAVRVPTDTILFNIDSKATSGNTGRDAIINVFLKVFNEFRGFSADHPHVAFMEKHLSEKGLYQRFKEKFKELSGEIWEEQRDAFHFYQDAITGALVDVLDMSQDSANKWFDESEKAFESQFSIENFARWVKEYLDSKGNTDRIVFLVDEIGQFIGQDTQLMLTLQTITEELGTICEGRAWVIVTSQEDLDSIIDEGLVGAKAHDFSKIQGRFRTRISLSSSNTDEVIQSRLLTKTDESKNTLLNIFQEKGDILRNQITFDNTGPVLKNYTDDETFANLYPFTPYQFDLVQKIFESIRKAGATGMHLSRGERSMLDAFQTAAINNRDKNIGILIPVYDFYPTIESFIDTVVKMTIDRAEEDGSLDEFDIKILKSLFLIRYIDDIKGTLDNLTTLCINEIDTDKIELKTKIDEALKRLERQNLITRNGNIFQYLTKAEQDVNRAINRTEISSAEENKLLSDILFKEILNDQRKYRHTNSNDYSVLRILDGNFLDNTSNTDLIFEIISELNENYDAYTENFSLLKSVENQGRIILKLPSNPELYKELRRYIKTEKYLRKESDVSDNEYAKIINEKQIEQRERKQRLILDFKNLILSSFVVAYNAILDVNSSSPESIFKDACKYLLENTFGKLNYVSFFYNEPLRELKALLAIDDLSASQLEIDSDPNSAAIKEIQEYIRLRANEVGNILVSEIIERFSKRPFGWRDGEIVIFLTKLYLNGYIVFYDVATKQSVKQTELYEYLSRTNKRREITIAPKRQTDERILRQAREIGFSLFDERGPDNEKELYLFLKENLESIKNKLNEFKNIARMGNFPGREDITNSLTIISNILQYDDSYEFFQKLINMKDDFEDLREDFEDLEDFYTGKIHIWQKLATSLDIFQSNAIFIERDVDAYNAYNELKQIYNSPSPYGRIREIEDLIDKVDKTLSGILENLKNDAMECANSHIEKIKNMIDENNLSADESNRLLMPLQRLKNRINEETLCSNISTLKEQVINYYDEIIAEIEDIINLPGDIPGTQENIQVSRVSIVSAKDFIGQVYSKRYLDTKDDVEDFITKLKEKLIKEIEDNKKIRI